MEVIGYTATVASLALSIVAIWFTLKTRKDAEDDRRETAESRLRIKNSLETFEEKTRESLSRLENVTDGFVAKTFGQWNDTVSQLRDKALNQGEVREKAEEDFEIKTREALEDLAGQLKDHGAENAQVKRALETMENRIKRANLEAIATVGNSQLSELQLKALSILARGPVRAWSKRDLVDICGVPSRRMTTTIVGLIHHGLAERNGEGEYLVTDLGLAVWQYEKGD